MENRQISGGFDGAGAPPVPPAGYWISSPIHLRGGSRKIAGGRGYQHIRAAEPDMFAGRRGASRSQRGRIGRISTGAGYLYPYEHEAPREARPVPEPRGFWRQLAADAAWIVAAFTGLAVAAVALGGAL